MKKTLKVKEISIIQDKIKNKGNYKGKRKMNKKMNWGMKITNI